MNENWMALYAAIVNEKLSVDKALLKMGISIHSTSHMQRTKLNYKNDEIEEMIRLKEQGATYKEISKMFGAPSGQAVCQKIKKYKERMMVA